MKPSLTIGASPNSSQYANKAAFWLVIHQPEYYDYILDTKTEAIDLQP